VQAFLSEFAGQHASEGKRILLIWDGAPAHRATALNVSERISLMNVPAYTPELNPSERVWPLVKEGVANRAHERLDELEQKVCSRSVPKKSRRGQVITGGLSYEPPLFSLQLGITLN
jgi:transposase